MSVTPGGIVTVPVRKADQVAGLIRARIADGSLKPGALAPSGKNLALETGFAVLTCRAALRLLVDEGSLTRLSQTARPRVAGGERAGWQEMAVDLARSLAWRRHRAGVKQAELAAAIGVHVTSVTHAETGRLWQARRFWEKADLALGAAGDLLARYDAWRAALKAEAADALLAPCDARQVGPAAGAAAGEPVMSATTASPEALAAPAEPDGIVITLPCDPMPVTVRWGDGSVTTMGPGTL